MSTASSFSTQNLLDTFTRRDDYRNFSAFGQLFKFLILAGVWTGIVLSAAAGGAVTFAWALPLAINMLPKFLPVSVELAAQAAEVMQFLAPVVTVATFIPVNALFLVLCERKTLALLTMRTGPTDVGPNGFLQTMADAVKLLFKEDICPDGSDRLLFFLSPALFFAPAMVVFMPLTAVAADNVGVFRQANFDIGLLFMMAIASMGTMCLVMAGWSSNNKYSLIGGLRAAAQAVSYEIPMVLAIIAIVLMTGSVNLVEVSDSQAGGLLNWNIFGQGKIVYITNLFANSGGDYLQGFLALIFVGLCAFLFLIFLTASIAEVNRIPFDIPEAESELVSGFNTEFTGMKFALFFLAEYTNLFIVSGISVVMFLGGSHLPISHELESSIYVALSDVTVNLPLLGNAFGILENLNLVWTLTSLVFIVKIYSMIVLAIWIRATLPRLRVDQLMEFGWKYLIPVSLLCIFLMAILLEYFN